jgi:hypothetical protein
MTLAKHARILGVHSIKAAEPLYLLELEIEGDGFDFGEVTQDVPDAPRSDWQVAYDEREVGDGRFAFFFHDLDTSRPLLSSFGPLLLPPESQLPDHLRNVEYDSP